MGYIIHNGRSRYAPADNRPSLDQYPLVELAGQLRKFQVAKPVVSIVMPAYNEERLLLRTLQSLAGQQTKFATELLVVNNNSTDRTQELLDRCGIRSLFVVQPGVAYARQAGLEAARGRYVASADADCWYPATWVDALVGPLNDSAVSCTYGLHSFMPEAHSSRLALSVYEWFSEQAARMRPTDREFINVLGMNFAFRRADALSVGGYNLEAGHRGGLLASAPGRVAPGQCEDGWMALSLQKLGRLQCVTSRGARVWTSDRRLLNDSSLQHAFLRRVRREVVRFTRPRPVPVRSLS